MRRALALALAAALLAAPAAHADLYRWREPGTGTIRYSNYPPPWMENDAQVRAGPAVEILRAPQAPAVAPAADGAAAPPDPAKNLEQLNARRRGLLAQIEALARRTDREAARGEFERAIAEYQQVMDTLDRFEPKGGDGRRAEDVVILRRVAAALGARGAGG